MPALRRAPCRIAFSAGRDSSLVLAAAQRSAARHALGPPVAVTLRLEGDGAREADESAWQELVVDHLRPESWIRVPSDGDIDLVGPIAAPLLRDGGPYYPANAHTLLPLLVGDGGSLVLGFGGDELLSPPLWQRHNDVLARRRRPAKRDVLRMGVAAAPKPLRRPWVRRAAWRSDLTWLLPEAQRRLHRFELRDHNEPVRFASAVRAEARRRELHVAVATLRRLGARRGVEVHAPLLDPLVVEAVARAGGRRGFGSRTAAMQAIAGDVLPAAVISRVSKAGFTRSLYGATARRFAQEWSGEGVPRSLVDSSRLRDAWLHPPGDFRAALLLQAAWCHDHRSSA